MLREKLGTAKCFRTAWGKLITEEEAYTQINRQIAAVCANLFQVMRIFEPSWEKRTEAICEIANMMNMAVAGTPEDQKEYVNMSLHSIFRNCVRNPAGLEVSRGIPEMSGKTWQEESFSLQGTV